jgi:hypothetical protein
LILNEPSAMWHVGCLERSGTVRQPRIVKETDMSESQSGHASDRWSIARYGAAAVAATAGLAAATPAQAAIIYTNPADVTVDNTSSPGSLNMDNAGLVEYTFAVTGPAGDQVADISGVNPVNQIASNKPTGNPVLKFAVPLAPNAPIPGTHDFDENAKFATSDLLEPPVGISGPAQAVIFNPWADPAFAGLQFLLGTNTHFGWAQFQVTVDSTTDDFSVTLFDYAYCDQPRHSINAGQTTGECGPFVATPEPSSLLLLATGAVAVEALRRLRRRRDAA